MKKFINIIGFLFIFFFTTIIQAKNTIVDYQKIFLPVYTSSGQLLIALRVFKFNDVPAFLIVNPETLKTNVLPINKLQNRNIKQQKKPGYFTYANVQNTRYYQVLNQYTSEPYILENQGITHLYNTKEGNVLTIDLCPSTKSFEKEFFNKLVELSEVTNNPLPITIAISGMWIAQHQDEFQWLLDQQQNKKLAITWVNHSFSHVYYSDLPYSENFLLSENVNLELEVLLTEKYLLEYGQIPSIFYRFPGLVSDETLIKNIKKFGLVPLGADAWLAKDQKITAGGIILVHGNGNEHEGIVLILPLLDKLLLLDINQAI